MFSRIDVLNALSMGDLKIEPFEQRLLLPNSLKVRLDNELAIAKKGKTIRVYAIDVNEDAVKYLREKRAAQQS
jgi:deoxycytidine triphosphate deaminase